MTFLDNYEDVNARIKRFRAEFPSGRLVAEIVEMDLTAGWILIRAEAYREFEDFVPSAVDYAYGNVATLTANMRKWLVEDTTTSAYGRCIGLLTPSDNARPTKQDMEKVEALPPTSDPWLLSVAAKDSGTTAIGTVIELVKKEVDPSGPAACKHGRMVFKSGVSKTTGNKYEGWTCPSANRDDQCKPVWL